MDTQALRETYDQINACRCPFEKTILSGQASCGRADRFWIAEREGVRCQSDPAQRRCTALLETLRDRARFTLKAIDQQAALAHAKAMRVQVGGLFGLFRSLYPRHPLPRQIADIDALIEQAIGRFGRLDALPFGDIVQQIAAYQGRRPGRAR